MKKLKFFTFLFALVSALSASAQTLVKDAGTELIDGTLISLQCRDTNGGSGYYFNGGNAKSQTFGKANLFVVKGNATEGLKLCRLSDGKYVGQASADANALVTDVETADEAITFTAKSYGIGNFTFSSGGTKMEGSVDALYVRFSLADGRFLNTNETALTPKLFNGTGGFSAWYVYKYDAVDLDMLGVEYTFGELDAAGVPAVCRVGSRLTTSEVPEGKILVRGAGGRPGWLHAGGQTETHPYLWNNGATPATGKYIWTAEKVDGSETGEFYLKSSVAGYISRGNVQVFTQNVEEAMKFRLAAKSGAEAGVFNLQTESSYLNMDPTTQDSNHDDEGDFIVTQWNDVNDANGKWEIYPCNVPAEICNVTYIIKNGEKEVYRTTIEVLEGDIYPQIPAGALPGFIVVSGYPEGTVSESGEYVLTYTTNLPFEPSTSFGEAKWYAMDVHSNEANYVVYYEEGVKVKNNGTDTDYQNSADESEQWCFVGNVWDGFKIYNRTAGNAVSLYQPSDADVEITMSEDGQAFRAYEGAIANSAAFKLADRRYYFNHRGDKLQGWTAADQGSSFRFFPVLTEDEQLVALAADVNAQLATIEEAFAGLNRAYPVKAEGVAEVIWPDEYKNQFRRENGFEDNFELLNYAEQAVAEGDKDKLTTAKANLETFINLSNAHGYPREVIYTVSSEENVNYGTAYMPFNTTCPTGLKLYECTGVEENGYTMILDDYKGTNREIRNFVKNTAYIIETTNSNVKGNKYQFISYGNQQGSQANSETLLVGTHEDCDAPVGSYVLQNQNNVLGFYKVESGNTITVPAHKCYLQLPAEAQGVKFLLFPDGTPTSIDAIDAAKPADAAIYDLSGRRVTTTTRGLYIVDGKKVLVK